MAERIFTVPDGTTIITEGMIPSDTTIVIIPEGVTEIGDNAFKGCTSLESITIPKGVTSIGESAFDGCTSLN